MHWKAIMTDSLRDRIAALLELLRPVTPTEAADAVIRELGLIECGDPRCDCRQCRTCQILGDDDE